MSIKQQERSVSDPRYDRMRRSKTSLREKMSEIISLREQVAQAELAMLDSEGDGASKHATTVREKHREPPV